MTIVQRLSPQYQSICNTVEKQTGMNEVQQFTYSFPVQGALFLFFLSSPPPRSVAARSQQDKQINCLRAAKQENIHNKCTTEGVTTWKHNKASLIFCAGTFQGVH